MLSNVQKVLAEVAKLIINQFWVQFCWIQISETPTERFK